MTAPCFLLKENLPKNFQPPRNYGKWKTKMWILLTNGDNYLDAFRRHVNLNFFLLLKRRNSSVGMRNQGVPKKMPWCFTG